METVLGLNLERQVLIYPVALKNLKKSDYTSKKKKKELVNFMLWELDKCMCIAEDLENI